jgi:hypothetical protein
MDSLCYGHAGPRAHLRYTCVACIESSITVSKISAVSLVNCTTQAKASASLRAGQIGQSLPDDHGTVRRAEFYATTELQ